MRINVPAKHARALSAVIGTVCDKYSGLARDAATLAGF